MPSLYGNWSCSNSANCSLTRFSTPKRLFVSQVKIWPLNLRPKIKYSIKPIIGIKNKTINHAQDDVALFLSKKMTVNAKTKFTIIIVPNNNVITCIHDHPLAESRLLPKLLHQFYLTIHSN